MDAFFASAAEYFQGSGSGFVSVFCTVWRRCWLCCCCGAVPGRC